MCMYIQMSQQTLVNRPHRPDQVGINLCKIISFVTNAYQCLLLCIDCISKCIFMIHIKQIRRLGIRIELLKTFKKRKAVNKKMFY